MISDDRLFHAAEALLNAVGRDGDRASMVMLVDEPSDAQDLPDGVFTATELTEALNFLMRLGLIDATTLGNLDPDDT